jgi:hypothetical protein
MTGTSKNVNSMGWTVEVLLISNAGSGQTQKIAEITQQKSMNWTKYSSKDEENDGVQELDKVTIRKPGIYLLRFIMDHNKCQTTSAGANGNGVSAFDNIELKLDKRLGFFIKVR